MPVSKHCRWYNYLKGRDGDCANVILAAAGYNFALLLRWREAPLRAPIHALRKGAFVAQLA